MRRALNSLALACFALLSLSLRTPQSPPATECPTITIDCPTTCYKPNQPFTVTANVTGADASKSLSYVWSVSSGTITSGQGTSSITITQSDDCLTMTATVEVKGLDASCQSTASCSTVTDCCWDVPSRRYDKYGDLAFADEKKRLDHFAEQLKNEPSAQGYIMVYGKRGARTGEAEARATRAKDYLVTKGGIVAERLVTIEGGDHEKFSIELWITPQGGQPPTPVDQYGEAPEG
jgi:hypothetical protein